MRRPETRRPEVPRPEVPRPEVLARRWCRSRWCRVRLVPRPLVPRSPVRARHDGGAACPATRAPPTLAPAAPTGAGATPGGGPASAQPPRKTVAGDDTAGTHAQAVTRGGFSGGTRRRCGRNAAQRRARAAGSGRGAGAAPATAATAPAAAERVHALNELPDDVRRAVPNFTFGGAVYSDNAANRMLIINGQLFNEGGQPSAGVVLDQIRLKSAVFRYRGYRYEMPY